MDNSSSCCSNNSSTAPHRAASEQHSVCINTCHAYNTRRTAVIPGISGPRGTTAVLGCEATRRQTKKRWKKTSHQKKKRARRGLNHQLNMLMLSKLRVQPLSYLHDIRQIDVYLYIYVRIDTRDRRTVIWRNNEEKTRRRETTRARPRPPPAE